MGNLAGHQELQRVFRAGVVGEVDQALVDDLGSRFGGDVAAQVDVELAGDLQVIGRPGIPHRVTQGHAAAPGDGDQRVRFRSIAVELHRLEVQAREGADDLEVAQFFRPDIHQEIFPFGILAVEPLHGVLHCRRKLPIRAAELLEQHVPELRVRRVDANRVHKLLHMVVHESSLGAEVFRRYSRADEQEPCRSERMTSM